LCILEYKCWYKRIVDEKMFLSTKNIEEHDGTFNDFNGLELLT